MAIGDVSCWKYERYADGGSVTLTVDTESRRCELKLPLGADRPDSFAENERRYRKVFAEAVGALARFENSPPPFGNQK